MFRATVAACLVTAVGSCVYEPRHLDIPDVPPCTAEPVTAVLSPGGSGTAVDTTDGPISLLVGVDETATLIVSAACGEIAWDTSEATALLCANTNRSCLVIEGNALIAYGAASSDERVQSTVLSAIVSVEGQAPAARRIDVVWLDSVGGRSLFVDAAAEADGDGTPEAPMASIQQAWDEATATLATDPTLPMGIYVRGDLIWARNAPLAVPQGMLLVGGLDSHWRPQACHCQAAISDDWATAMTLPWATSCAAGRLMIKASPSFSGAALVTFETTRDTMPTVLEGVALIAANVDANMDLIASTNGNSGITLIPSLSIVRSTLDLRPAAGRTGRAIYQRIPLHLTLSDTELLVDASDASGLDVDSPSAALLVAHSCLSVSAAGTSQGVVYRYTGAPAESRTTADVLVTGSVVRSVGGTQAAGVAFDGAGHLTVGLGSRLLAASAGPVAGLSASTGSVVDASSSRMEAGGQTGVGANVKVVDLGGSIATLRLVNNYICGHGTASKLDGIWVFATGAIEIADNVIHGWGCGAAGDYGNGNALEILRAELGTAGAPASTVARNWIDTGTNPLGHAILLGGYPTSSGVLQIVSNVVRSDGGLLGPLASSTLATRLAFNTVSAGTSVEASRITSLLGTVLAMGDAPLTLDHNLFVTRAAVTTDTQLPVLPLLAANNTIIVQSFDGATSTLPEGNQLAAIEDLATLFCGPTDASFDPHLLSTSPELHLIGSVAGYTPWPQDLDGEARTADVAGYRGADAFAQPACLVGP